MGQEFHVLRCYSCLTFQTHIVKKIKKWECKMCGEKQSLKKVYGQGTGKDCRLHTQKLNELRLKKEEIPLDLCQFDMEYWTQPEENSAGNENGKKSEIYVDDSVLSLHINKHSRKSITNDSSHLQKKIKLDSTTGLESFEDNSVALLTSLQWNTQMDNLEVATCSRSLQDSSQTEVKVHPFNKSSNSKWSKYLEAKPNCYGLDEEEEEGTLSSLSKCRTVLYKCQTTTDHCKENKLHEEQAGILQDQNIARCNTSETNESEKCGLMFENVKHNINEKSRFNKSVEKKIDDSGSVCFIANKQVNKGGSIFEQYNDDIDFTIDL